MNGTNLWLVSALFLLATLTACSDGGNGSGAGPNPPVPVPGEPGPTPPPGPQGGVSLPRTGQTTCYDTNNTDAEVSCPGTGQDGELQKGVAEPNPRFSVDSTSNCMTDNLTGLMWARNGNLAATDPALPATGRRIWQEALNFANDLELCGFSDWRLPNRNELRSLINHGSQHNANSLNEQGFINAGAFNDTTTTRIEYWSSTSNLADPTRAFLVDFTVGNISSAIKQNYPAFIWPVRARQ